MKGKDIIIHALRAEMPDMEQLRQICIQQATSKSITGRNVWIRRLVPITACVVLMVAMFTALPYLQNNMPGVGNNSGGDFESGYTANSNENNVSREQGNEPPDNQPSDEQIPQYNDELLPPEFVGLPVNNFCLSDSIQNNDGISESASRIEFSRLQHFVRCDSAVVRVIETERWSFTNRYGRSFEMQTSTLEIIEVLQGDFPQTVSIFQTVTGADWATNVLRGGGVYLLPLLHENVWNPRNGNIEIGWRIADGAQSVLFEVDDNGNIWSHSPYRGFNQFDGKPARAVADAIISLATCENFEIAHTDLGLLSGSVAFAEITVSSNEKVTIHHWQYYEYTISIENVFTTDLRRDNWSPQLGNARALAWGESDVLLTNGGRYIAALYMADSGGERLHVRLRDMARINADGTITGVVHTHWNFGRSESAFAEFNGYTVPQIANVIDRARAWHEAYSAD